LATHRENYIISLYMESRAHYLAVLGLAPDASNEDATAAYKDLVRVWHPDRFQNDDRLRKRAEEETKKINEAISKVKKLPKDSPKPRADKRPSQPERRAEPRPENFSHARGPSSFARQTIEIAPLIIKQRMSASLVRLAVGVISILASLSALESQPNTTLESCTSIAVIFFGSQIALWNLALLIRRPEVARVDKFGLYLIGFGRLMWPDLQGMWAGRSARATYLAINFSQEYLAQQNLLRRLLYWLRSKLGRSHSAFSFSGLTGDAIQVVNTINLRHETGHLSVPNVATTPQTSLFWCNFVSLLCPIMVIWRAVSQDVLEPVDYLPYAGVFLLCRLYITAKSAIFSKPARI
jgi:hypothetical protein